MQGEWNGSHTSTAHTPVLSEEGGTEKRFAKLPEGSEHCHVPRKTIASEICFPNKDILKRGGNGGIFHILESRKFINLNVDH